MPRTKAPLVAALSVLCGEHPVILVDISRTGARVSGEFLPQAVSS